MIALATALCATLPFHAIAFVNDPLSHGAVGDSKLSLNEAIQLHNGTLLYSQLSPFEQAQLSVIPGTGGTTDVTWIDIDGGNVPVITIEQDLDPILDTSYGLLIKGFGERPVLDFSGANITQGLHSPSNAVTVEDIVIHGGPFGLRVMQTDVAGQPGAVLQGVRFEDQTQYAVRVAATTNNGVGRFIVNDCEFDDVPTAIEYLDTGANRTTICEVRRSRITGVGTGVAASLGSGGLGRFAFDRLVVDGATQGIELQLPTTNGRPLLIEGEHVRIRAQNCFTATVAHDADTWIDCAMWQLLTNAPGGIAMQIGAQGDPIYGDIDEFTFAGDVDIRTGGHAQPLTLRNARSRDGDVTLATSTTQPMNVRESRFDDCAVQTPGPGTISVHDSCFVGGAFGTTGLAATFVTDNCFVQNGGSALASSQSLPAPQLGSTTVTPDDVDLGSTITFGVDLPSGLLALLIVGVAAEPVIALPAPFHVYVDTAEFVIVPGVYTAQQTFAWNVPNLAQFVGNEYVLQSIVLPDAGMQAPWLQMPPGWRFELR